MVWCGGAVLEGRRQGDTGWLGDTQISEYLQTTHVLRETELTINNINNRQHISFHRRPRPLSVSQVNYIGMKNNKYFETPGRWVGGWRSGGKQTTN